jgi:transcriptional regulator with XRE-family HTH domain
MTTTVRRNELKRIMQEKRLTAHDVARIVYKSPSTVYAWRCGTRTMPKSSLRLLTLSIKG